VYFAVKILKMKTKKVAIIGAALLLGFVAICIFVHSCNQRSAIKATLTWARLSPFPQSAHDLAIRTEGTMFTRSFRIQFTASSEDIDHWLADSTGTREAVPEKPTATTRHYMIKPGGGAQHAEVSVDDVSHTVSIYVYWS
jgi:hypothetical protein